MISLFRGAGLLTQLLTVGALFAAAATGYTLWKQHQQNIGWNKGIAAIAAQDERAVNEATNIRASFKSCLARDGMRWDQQTSKCQRR